MSDVYHIYNIYGNFYQSDKPAPRPEHESETPKRRKSAENADSHATKGNSAVVNNDTVTNDGNDTVINDGGVISGGNDTVINDGGVISGVMNAAEGMPEPSEVLVFKYISDDAVGRGMAGFVENELSQAAKGSAAELVECILREERLGNLVTQSLSSKRLFNELKKHFNLPYKYRNFVKKRH